MNTASLKVRHCGNCTLNLFTGDGSLLIWRMVQPGQETIKSRAGYIQCCLFVIILVLNIHRGELFVETETGSSCIYESRVQIPDKYHNLNILNELSSHESCLLKFLSPQTV